MESELFQFEADGFVVLGEDVVEGAAVESYLLKVEGVEIEDDLVREKDIAATLPSLVLIQSHQKYPRRVRHPLHITDIRPITMEHFQDLLQIIDESFVLLPLDEEPPLDILLDLGLDLSVNLGLLEDVVEGGGEGEFVLDE